MMLDPDQKTREQNLKRRIALLEQELSEVQKGHIKVLKGDTAIEGIREVYDLSMSLRADFRRVEDSYRAADQQLRQSIISDGQHRGQVVDRLLDSHDTLLNTPEGQVFNGFHQQLLSVVELNNMQAQLRQITSDAVAENALSRQQRSDLRGLIIRLSSESKGVIKARARSERDVKGFLKTGLAAEHHRVGQLLNALFDAALDVNWDQQVVRRAPAPLYCIAVNISGLPLIQRLKFKQIQDDQSDPLELSLRTTNLTDIDGSFWHAFDALDHQALLDETKSILIQSGKTMSIGELTTRIETTHDLESIVFWLSMARQAGVPVHSEEETVDITNRDGQQFRFRIPVVALSAEGITAVQWEI